MSKKVTSTNEPLKKPEQQNYQQQHMPSSAFNSREAYLEHELTIMEPNAGVLIYPLKIIDSS